MLSKQHALRKRRARPSESASPSCAWRYSQRKILSKEDTLKGRYSQRKILSKDWWGTGEPLALLRSVSPGDEAEDANKSSQVASSFVTATMQRRRAYLHRGREDLRRRGGLRVDKHDQGRIHIFAILERAVGCRLAFLVDHVPVPHTGHGSMSALHACT